MSHNMDYQEISSKEWITYDSGLPNHLCASAHVEKYMGKPHTEWPRVKANMDSIVDIPVSLACG